MRHKEPFHCATFTLLLWQKPTERADSCWALTDIGDLEEYAAVRDGGFEKNSPLRPNPRLH